MPEWLLDLARSLLLAIPSWFIVEEDIYPSSDDAVRKEKVRDSTTKLGVPGSTPEEVQRQTSDEAAD